MFKIIFAIISITALFIFLLFWNKNILVMLLLVGVIVGGLILLIRHLFK